MGNAKPEREARKRHAVTSRAMRSYAEVLRTIAERHDSIASVMDEQKMPYIDAGNVKTALEGIHRLSKFLGAATEALIENAAGFGMMEFSGAVAMLQAITRRAAESVDGVEAPVFPSKGPVDTPEQIEQAAQIILTREKNAVQQKQQKKGGRTTNNSH